MMTFQRSIRIVLRYFNVFGPRQNLDGDTTAVIPQFIRKLADGVRPIIFGDGSQTRDFTYVDSVVEANLRAVKASITSGAILNIATGSCLSLNSLVEIRVANRACLRICSNRGHQTFARRYQPLGKAFG
jgi:nucleoside-diphosphate-sugar epimerase